MEIQNDVRQEITKAKALESYAEASSIASNELKPANPVRLGVALNFSVFYHEILHSPDLAIEIAKKAFDTAFIELNSISEDWNKESTTIMQLIKENLSVWMGNNPNSDSADLTEVEDVTPAN